MKTIIARFTEIKEAPSGIVNVDGEEVDVNKVDTALKSVGVSLKDTTGQFRDLDDVFLDLAKKWDTLDLMQQRYVATTAAGSRQQSRFIAMMDNYDRTMELVNAANNSAGASSEQFEKTVESLESKLNKLSNAWNEFTMGLANSTVIKTGVDLLTGLLNVINDITGAFGDGIGGALKFGVAIGGLKLGKSLVNKGFGFIGGALGTKNTKPEEKSDGFFKTAGKAFKKETWVGKKVDYSETIKDLNNYEQSVKNVSKAKNELAKIEEKQILLNKKVSKSDKEISSLNSGNRKKNKKVKKDLRERIKKNAKDPNGIEIKGKRKQDITPLEFATAERDKNAKAAQENIKQQVIAQQQLNNATVQQDAILKKLNITQTQNEALDKLGITTDQKAVLLSNEKTSSLTKEIIANDKLTDEEKDLTKEVYLLTSKPILYIANVSEEQLVDSDNDENVNKVREYAKKENASVIPLCVKIEEELSSLEGEDKKEMLEALGLDESGLDKVVKASYDLLGLMSFLTAGEPEVRAWTIKKGTKAPEAAGKIHSDIQRGFIKAEVVSYDDLIREGSMNAVREKGLLRMEGKEYIMQDGDIVLFRFNV